MKISREELVRQMGDILGEYEKEPDRVHYTIGQFKGLYEVANLTFVRPDTLPTLAEVDAMARKTLKMEGTIIISPDAPADPSVGLYRGTTATRGQINGSFLVPASAVVVSANEEPRIVTDDWNPGGTVMEYITENLIDAIEEKAEGRIAVQEDYHYRLVIALFGVMNYFENRARVEFEVKVEEI